jgi:hypothetical protein
MIHDALGAFAAASSPNDRDEASSTLPQSKMDIEEFVALQSKTLVSILNEKVAAANERTRRLSAQYQQDQHAVSGEDQLQRGMSGYSGADTDLILPCAAQETNLRAANEVAIELE